MSLQIFDGLAGTRIRRSLRGVKSCADLVCADDVVAACSPASVLVETPDDVVEWFPGAWQLAITPDRRLVGLGFDGYWHRALEGEAEPTETPLDLHACAALSPSGACVATADAAGRVILHDVSHGAARGEVDLGRPVELLAVDDAGRVAAVDSDGALWLTDDGGPRRWHSGGGCRSLAFSPDGTRLLAAFRDGSVRVWTLDRPDAVVTLEDAGSTAVFDGSGRHVIATNMHATRLRTFDATSGHPRSTIYSGSHRLRWLESMWSSGGLAGRGDGQFALVRPDLGAASLVGIGLFCALLFLFMLAYGAYELIRPAPRPVDLRQVTGSLSKVHTKDQGRTLCLHLDGDDEVVHRIDGPVAEIAAIAGQLAVGTSVQLELGEEVYLRETNDILWSIRTADRELLGREQAAVWNAPDTGLARVFVGFASGMLLLVLAVVGPPLLRELGIRPFGVVHPDAHAG